MNAIAQFRKCTLSNEELLKEVDRLTDQIYKDGKIPTRQIPARPNQDYDLLVGELILRFAEQSKSDYLQTKLTEYTDFLLKHGYVDTDVYAEPPTAIDKFLASKK